VNLRNCIRLPWRGQSVKAKRVSAVSGEDVKRSTEAMCPAATDLGGWPYVPDVLGPGRSAQQEARGAPSSLILTRAQIKEFRENGFLTLEAISAPEELALLRRIFARLLHTKAGFNEGAQFDLLGAEDEVASSTLRQIMNPANYAPELRETLYHVNALAIAKQLLGDQAAPLFEDVILKPAHHGAATPWHQDEAYRSEPDFVYREITIWMPLQEVTLDNGCLHFVPGSHRGEVLTHRPANNNAKSHALECCAIIEASAAVACPLPAGGCTIHDGRTLHYAGPNRSGAPRWAYILAFDLPPTPCTGQRHFAWNDQRHSADMARKRAWLRRGGVLIEAWRRLRKGVAKNPERINYLMHRVWGRL
jgi:ectoine hydroxylase-related dioxygenase (phytanoyl-CoA dioxygenase family)